MPIALPNLCCANISRGISSLCKDLAGFTSRPPTLLGFLKREMCKQVSSKSELDLQHTSWNIWTPSYAVENILNKSKIQSDRSSLTVTVNEHGIRNTDGFVKLLKWWFVSQIQTVSYVPRGFIQTWQNIYRKSYKLWEAQSLNDRALSCFSPLIPFNSHAGMWSVSLDIQLFNSWHEWKLRIYCKEGVLYNFLILYTDLIWEDWSPNYPKIGPFTVFLSLLNQFRA